jgi:hypothetical protein
MPREMKAPHGDQLMEKQTDVPQVAVMASNGGGGNAGPWRPGGKGKLRLDRGPLRWWLLVVGMLTINFDWTRFWIGSSLVLIGAAAHLATKGVLHQNRRLTTGGPYRFTRNPFYVVTLVAEVGLLVIIGRWWLAAVYLLAWAWVYRRQIASEERTLEGLFGDDFRRYRAAVPAFLPVPWRFLPRPAGGGDDAPAFSWRNQNIARGRAAERAVRLLSYPLALLCAAMIKRDGWQSLAAVGSPAAWAGCGFVLVNLLGAATTALIRRSPRAAAAVATASSASLV